MRGASNGARGPSRCQLSPPRIHFHTKSRIRDRGFVLLGHVQLALLLEPRASVPLTQDLELRPVCDELLRETPLRRDGARRSGLLVLGAGRRRGSNLVRASKSAQEGDKPSVCRVRRGVP